MPFLQDVRNQLLISHYDNLINDEEYLLLYDVNKSDNLDLPYHIYERFELDDLENDQCLSEFRFQKHDVPLLAEHLGLPEIFRCDQRSTSNKMEGLCILLKRLAYPCRYSDMIARFARPVPVLSMICNTVLDFIFERHQHRVLDWNNIVLNPHCLEEYSNAISAKGAALQNCFGFIDGTVRPISKPGINQRCVYNGHKRVHALKFQSLALPNGIIGNMFGPVEGRRHDAGMLADSGLLQELERNAFSPAGLPMCIYGDLAYPLRIHLQAPFRGAVLTQQMMNFNTSMSSCRISVEWLFGDIINYFRFMDFKKNLKIGLSSVGKLYVVCAILRNALTCLYGNSTSDYFQIDPPTLQEYFA